MLQHILSFADGVPTSERMEFDLGDGTAAPPRINRLRLVSKAWDVAFRQSVCALRVFCNVDHFDAERLVTLYPRLESLEIAPLQSLNADGEVMYTKTANGGQLRFVNPESIAKSLQLLQIKPYKELVLHDRNEGDWMQVQNQVESFRAPGQNFAFPRDQFAGFASWLASLKLHSVDLGDTFELDNLLTDALCSGCLKEVRGHSLNEAAMERIANENDLQVGRTPEEIRSANLYRLHKLQRLPRTLHAIEILDIYAQDFMQLTALPGLQFLVFHYLGSYAETTEEFNQNFEAFIDFLTNAPCLKHVECALPSSIIGSVEWGGRIKHEAKDIQARALRLLEAIGGIEIEIETRSYDARSTNEGMQMGGAVWNVYHMLQSELFE